MSILDRSGPTWWIRTKPATGTPQDVSDDIFELTYEDDEKKADKLTLKVQNFDLSNFSTKRFAKGVTLTVRWGYPGNMSPEREVVIQKVTGFQILNVEALDKGILMNKQTASRTFDKATRSDVVKVIAKEEGYDAKHIEATTHIYDHIVQARLTNAQFLKELAKQEGFEFFVDFDGLHWHRKNLSQEPARELVWFADGTGTLKTVDVTNDVTATPAAVVQKGRDPLKKENFQVTGDDKSTRRTGSPILEAIDPRTASTHDTIDVAAGTAVTSPTTEPDASAAKRVVDGQFRQAQITLVELKCTTVGEPSFLAKTVLKLAGLGALSGNYYVTAAKHTVNANGFEIEFECKRDGRDHPTDGVKPAKSKANPNNLNAKDDGTLEGIETIDGRRATTTWTDSRGRGSVK